MITIPARSTKNRLKAERGNFGGYHQVGNNLFNERSRKNLKKTDTYATSPKFACFSSTKGKEKVYTSGYRRGLPRVIRTSSNVKRSYLLKLNTVDRLACFWGFLGGFLAQIEAEIYFHNDNEENFVVASIRGLVTLTTLITLYYIHRHYAILLRDKIIKQELHPESTFWDLSKFRRVCFYLEVLIVGIHNPPYVNFKSSVKQLDREDLYTSDMIAACWVLLRVYLILRPILHQNTLRIQRICNLCNIKNTTRFTFKMLMDEQPVKFQFGAMFVAAIIIGVAFRHAERIAVFDFKHYWNGFYVTGVTMLTIGYGDFIPVTHYGRFLMLVASLLGWTISSIFIVTITKSSFELSMTETKVYQQILTREEEKRELHPLARRLIGKRVLLYMRKSAIPPEELVERKMEIEWLRKKFSQKRKMFARLKDRKMLIDHLDQMSTKHERQFAIARDVMQNCTDSCDAAVARMDGTEFKLSISVFQLKLNTTKLFNIMYLWKKSQEDPESDSSKILRSFQVAKAVPCILHSFSGSDDYSAYMKNAFPSFEQMFSRDLGEDRGVHGSSSRENMASIPELEKERAKTPVKMTRKRSGRRRTRLLAPNQASFRRQSVINIQNERMVGFQRAQRHKRKTFMESLGPHVKLRKNSANADLTAVGEFLLQLRSSKRKEKGAENDGQECVGTSITEIIRSHLAEDKNEGTSDQETVTPGLNVDAIPRIHAQMYQAEAKRSLDGMLLPKREREAELKLSLERTKNRKSRTMNTLGQSTHETEWGQTDLQEDEKTEQDPKIESSKCVCGSGNYKSDGCICNSDNFETSDRADDDRRYEATADGGATTKVTPSFKTRSDVEGGNRHLLENADARRGADHLKDAAGLKRGNTKASSAFADKWKAAIEETRFMSRQGTNESTVQLSQSQIDEIAKSP